MLLHKNRDKVLTPQEWIKTGFISLLLLAMVSTAKADGYFYHEKQQGWHWYNEPLKEEDSVIKEQPMETPTSNPIKELNALKEQVESAKAQAVLNPTPTHVKNYIELQNHIEQKATEFARVWQTVLWSNPALDVSLQKPTNQLARQVYADNHQSDKSLAISQLAQDYGFFYFFRSDCPYCHAFSPLLKQFELTYGIKIMAISLDGKTIPEYPDAKPDNGASQQLGVTTVPALFAISPKNQVVIPITYGLISVDELAERLWQLNQQKDSTHAY